MTPQPEDGWTQDQPPAGEKPRRPSRPKGSTGGKRRAPKTAAIPLSQQLQLPYLLLSDVTRSRLPVTSGALYQQAPICAQAWDQFLMRYPALREKIESGMIAGDVVALVMAHLPIIQAAREEIAAQAAAQQAGYDGGIGPSATAA